MLSEISNNSEFARMAVGIKEFLVGGNTSERKEEKLMKNLPYYKCNTRSNRQRRYRRIIR